MSDSRVYISGFHAPKMVLIEPAPTWWDSVMASTSCGTQVVQATQEMQTTPAAQSPDIRPDT